MTVIAPGTLATIAAECGASSAEEPERNADRLAMWKARYPRDTVHVPEASQPPKWPIERAARAPALNVTRLPMKARARG
jgi:hypothetical protein